MNNTDINLALLKLTKRAESSDPKILVGTFVDTGMLTALLTSRDHQIIYGRRGTGKTHALIYLSEVRRAAGDICVYVDMRTVGSSIGIFSDESIPLSERATRLLRDTLTQIHDRLYATAIDSADSLNLGEIGAYLDAFLEAAIQTEVSGTVTTESSNTGSVKDQTAASLSLNASAIGAGVAASVTDNREVAISGQEKVSESGRRRHRVSFGSIGQALGKIAASITPKRIWVLLDEWSAVPVDLQPYLADLIRRCVLPVKGITVKIAAIEQRTQVQLSGEHGDYTGIEVGADISADLNLDDFMVFDNDASKAVQFFRRLLYNHYKAVQAEDSAARAFDSDSSFSQDAFTQRNAIEELVRAAEGVPRDAINIIGLCAQRANDAPISVGHVRAAAKTWYLRDKDASVSANPHAKALLHWIVDEVIAHRKARAFLLRGGVKHPLIDSLFDARVLHLLKRNISAQEEPGIRYDVYKIDYGCYVDLLTTAKEPQGLLPAGDTADLDGGYVDVPPDDYRAIRRAILDLAAFTARVMAH